MPLTSDELNRIDADADTKADLQDELSQYEREYTGLQEVSTDQTREEMLETARAAVERGLSDAGKTDALKKLLERQPESVVVPVTQAFLMLTHPKRKEAPVRITVFDDMGWSTRDKPYTEPRDPEEEPEVNQLGVATKRVDELPDWALPKLYDLVVAGDVKIFSSPDQAQQGVSKQVNRNKQILDDPSASPKFEYTRQGNAYDDETQQPLVAEPTAKFKRPEQRAAWNVLNNIVDGDKPLPGNPDEISTDPTDLTEAEKSRVERRIKGCLESPHRFARKARGKDFDERVFFDQLLECEMSGFNAPRSSNERIGGVTRPEVISIIRSLADSRGFDVVGRFVRDKPDTELSDDSKDLIGGTDLMTPQRQRRNRRSKMGEAQRGNILDQDYRG